MLDSQGKGPKRVSTNDAKTIDRVWLDVKCGIARTGLFASLAWIMHSSAVDQDTVRSVIVLEDTSHVIVLTAIQFIVPPSFWYV